MKSFYEFHELLNRFKNLFQSPKSSYISYTGIVLYWLDQRRLLRMFKDKIPSDWKTFAHHMTINIGPASEGPAKEMVGRTVQLKAVAIGSNEYSLAVKVETKIPSVNTTKHITIAVSPESEPKESNNISNWKPIDPITLRGTIKEVVKEGEAPKERVHTPQSEPAPEDPRQFMQMMAGKPEYVIRKAIQGKFPTATPEQIEKWVRGEFN